MNKDRINTGLEDRVDVVFGNFSLALKDNLIARNSNNLTSILIHKVFVPALKHTSCQSLANEIPAILWGNADFLCKIEYLKNVLVALETDCTKKSRDRQLLLTVNVSVHDIVDVSGKLNPRALKRYDTSTVERCAVGMHTLTKEHAWRTMQLSNNNTFSSIYDKSTI